MPYNQKEDYKYIGEHKEIIRRGLKEIIKSF